MPPFMPTTDPSPAEPGRVLLPLVVVVVLVVLGVGLLVRLGAGPFPDAEACTAEVGGVTAEISTEQAENASLIAAVGVGRGLPARAVSIALATAFQESKLTNLDGGDRDSLGLFQQRPSQGWGTTEQIQDPVYAANAFYDGLEEIDGYQDMRITEAAQAVQRSGFPEAYEQHAEGARALASALTGYSPGTFSCVVRHDDVEAERPGRSGLTPRAAEAAASLRAVFGDVALGGFEPGGVTTGHMEGSAHYDGRAIDVFVRPIDDGNVRRGWAIAQYLVANADRLVIEHVIFDDRIWTAGVRSEQGWRDYNAPESDDPGTQAILEHRDHVHLDVTAGG